MAGPAHRLPSRHPLTAHMIRAAAPPPAPPGHQVGDLMHEVAAGLTAVMKTFTPANVRVEYDGISIVEPVNSALSHGLRLVSDRGAVTVTLVADRAMAMGLCEVAFGGAGTEPPAEVGERPLSRTERQLTKAVLGALAVELPAKFSDGFGVTFSAEALDLPKPGREPAPVPCLCGRLLVYMFGYSGEIAVHLAETELEALLAARDTPTSFQALKPQLAVAKALQHSTLQLVALLPPDSMPLAEVANLRRGQLLKLCSTTATSVSLTAEGRTLYKAVLVPGGASIQLEIVAT